MSVQERIAELRSAQPKDKSPKKTDVALFGGSLLMILCCAVGPAVLGAAAGSLVGGWLGIACAVLLAAVVGLVLHRRKRGTGAC
jgi:hypothetical protein